MFQTLAQIIDENWSWRRQTWRLALFDLVKRSRGAALSYAWLFIKPAVYVLVFWFALDIGLKAGSGYDPSLPPYFVWLVSGLIPWFFMQDMFGTGSAVLGRYSYLVTKMRFPISNISTVYTLATGLVQLGLLVALFCIYFAYGLPLDVHLLQVPFIFILMLVFWDIFSILASELSAVSKDFANLMKALLTPLFWLSGIIFNVESSSLSWLRQILCLDPVTFFATAMRDAVYYHTWVWEDPAMCAGFALVFVVQLVVMCLVYRRLHIQVADFM